MNPLMITGMHRSGTSMITRILNICGLYIGPKEKLIPAGGDNPTGFWESSEVMNINGRILSAYFSDWRNPPELPKYFWDKKVMVGIHEIIKNFVTTYKQQRQWWGFKDPRFCFTLPMWKFWIQDLKVLVCLRDPLCVADSLMRRDNELTIDECLVLWFRYMQNLWDCTSKVDRIVVEYDSLFEDLPCRVFTLLNKLGGFNDYAVDYDKVEEASSTIIPKLRHHERTLKCCVKHRIISKRLFQKILDLYEDFAKEEIFGQKKD